MGDMKVYMGVLWVLLFTLYLPVLGEDSIGNSSGEILPASSAISATQSTLSARQQTEMEESPVLGGGVRNPPDIGMAGTASPTPPARTESPTNEPEYFFHLPRLVFLTPQTRPLLH